MKPNFNNKQKGVLLMISSAFLFSSMQISINLSGVNIPIMEQIFFRNLISLFLTFYIIKRRGIPLIAERKYQGVLFLRSTFGFLGLISLFYAAAHAYQGDVSTIMKLSPFFITILASIFLKEKISKIQIPSLIIAFLGALLLARPGFNSNLFPLFIAFICALCSSIAYTLLSYFKGKVDGMVVVFHFSVFSIIGTIPFMLFSFKIPNFYELLLLLSIGILGGLGQIAITYSYRMAKASEVSVYNYSGIVFSMILGFLFLDEVLPWTSLIGASLVILASILVYKFTPSK